MGDRAKRYGLACLCAGLMALPATTSGQTYRQQGIYPVFDGWETLEDGSKLFYFGYMNRHATEVTIPVGPDNSFDQAPADRMQPTNFLPGRHEHVFTVKLPKTFTGKFSWSVKSELGVQKANASPDQLYILEVEEEEPGAKVPPPTISAKDGSVKLSEALHVAPQVKAEAPKREAVIEGSGPRQSGLSVAWSKYRGPGKVTFAAEPGAARVAPPAPRGNRPAPPPVPGVFTTNCAMPVAAGCGAVSARFSEPGDYILRAIAQQGREQGDVLVHVKVTP
jgi:hypothetical protein